MLMNNEFLVEHIAPGRQFQILIVEDDEELLDYLGLLLQDLYTVYSASNVAQALKTLDNQRIDMIISDLNMPVLNGFDLLNEVRQRHQNLVPFLFLTAITEKTELMKALLLGVDAYMTKPFENDELLVRINNMLVNINKRKEIYAKKSHLGISKLQDGFLKEDEIYSFKLRWLKQLEEITNSELSNNNIRISDLAFKLAVSERTFRNRVKEYTGFSPNEYIMQARMNKALYLLENKIYMSVSEVAIAVGLGHKGYFSKAFKMRYGKLPSEYRSSKIES